MQTEVNSQMAPGLEPEATGGTDLTSIRVVEAVVTLEAGRCLRHEITPLTAVVSVGARLRCLEPRQGRRRSPQRI